MGELLTFLIMVGIFIIVTAVGIQKEQSKKDRPRRQEGFTQPLNTPRPRVSAGLGEIKSQTYRVGRMGANGKPVVHPLDYQKDYQDNDLRANLPQNARPVVSPETVPEIYFDPAKPSVNSQGRANSVRPDSEKSLVESPVQREVDEAEEFWKNPAPVAAKLADKGQTRGSELEQLRRDILPTTPQDLLQGIIMAEILEPPRSKRPYRPVFMEWKK